MVCLLYVIWLISSSYPIHWLTSTQWCILVGPIMESDFCFMVLNETSDSNSYSIDGLHYPITMVTHFCRFLLYFVLSLICCFRSIWNSTKPMPSLSNTSLSTPLNTLLSPTNSSCTTYILMGWFGLCSMCFPLEHICAQTHDGFCGHTLYLDILEVTCRPHRNYWFVRDQL